MHGSCMSFKTITIDEKAHALLVSLKHPGDSFSKVIHRHVRKPANTCGELLDEIWAGEPPDIDEKVLATVLKGRGRRSNRK